MVSWILGISGVLSGFGIDVVVLRCLLYRFECIIHFGYLIKMCDFSDI